MASRRGRGRRATLGAEGASPAAGTRVRGVGASREETLPIALAALVLVFVALLVCYSRSYMLLYGDAVAHLGTARRIVDARYPGLAQLGGVWLPMSHLIMLPFIWKMEWWQNGMAGAWPSMICYIVGVVGFFRLSRRLLPQRWAVVSTAFYALNPNLLYLATTAMTEPLFLAILIWLTLLTVECVSAVRAGAERRVKRLLVGVGFLNAAAVLTRYDGWILAAAVWCVLVVCVVRREGMWRRVAGPLTVLTLLTVAAPVSWLWYNQHYFHDWLDWMRGPYSAAGIEKRTSPPGSKHYRGWHNPGWALLFYTRTAQIDAAAWETGFALMAAALGGLWSVVRRRVDVASVLLWLPLPFYVYSVAYGAVPIFIPHLYPHAFYNARYGMEMLPALAMFGAVAGERLQVWAEAHERRALLGRLLWPVCLSLAALNAVWMMWEVPLVLKEGMVNARTRVAFETALAVQLGSFPKGVPILMSTSDHVGALQRAGIPLKQIRDAGDNGGWNPEYGPPSRYVAYAVAMAGDPVSQVMATKGQGFTEMSVLCTTGQPCARIYRSDRYERAR